MTTISDLIEERKNLSGIFTGAGGDRIPPHGTTHVKLGPDPIPQEIDGIPVDLEGINAGETIVLDAEGNLVPGAALGALVSLQTAYSNGATINATTDDLIFQIATGTKFDLRDAGSNPIFRFSDVASVSTLLLSADVLTLKDSNTATDIAIGGVGDPVFSTTKQSIIGAVNEVFASVAALLVAPPLHAATHEDGGSDEINAGNLSGTGEIGKSFKIADAITGNPDLELEQRATESIFNTTIALGSAPQTGAVVDGSTVIVNEGSATDTLVKIDLKTGVVVDSYVPSGADGGRAIVIVGRTLCVVNAEFIDEVPLDTFDSKTQITATGLDNSAGRCATTGPGGDIYSASSADSDAIYISVRASASYTVTKHTLPGITGEIRGICFDAAFTYFYISDSGYVRKYDVATRTLQASSPSFSGTIRYGIFEVLGNGDLLGCFNGIVKIFDTSDMSIKYTDASATVTEPVGVVADCTIVGLSDTSFSRYQFPGLTAAQPTHIDASDALSSIFKSGDMRQTHHDWMRATAANQQLDATRLGVDVISSVASTSSEITNATVGQRYIILEAVSTYPLHNHVFEMRSDGHHFYPPKLYDLVYIRSGSYRLEYDGSAWVQVEIPLRTVLTDLTDGGDSTAHYHAADRARANHTGTQTAATISNFDTEVSNNTDVAANTSARHAHDTVRAVTSTDEIELTDRDNTVHVTDARTAAVALSIDSAVLALDGFEFNVLVDYDASNDVALYAPTSANIWQMNGHASSGRALGYKFIIRGGSPHPFGTMPTYVAS